MASSGLPINVTEYFATTAYKTIKQLMLDTLRENEEDGTIEFITVTPDMGIPQVDGVITLHMWYNQRTNRFIIEYDLNYYGDLTYNDNGRFKTTFESKVRKYFTRFVQQGDYDFSSVGGTTTLLLPSGVDSIYKIYTSDTERQNDSVNVPSNGCVAVDSTGRLNVGSVVWKYNAPIWQNMGTVTTKTIPVVNGPDKIPVTFMKCEILHPEDRKRDQVDSAYLSLPTPYTIGYWKSVTGRYEFIEDRQQILADARIFMNPSDEIIDGKPPKRFEDFANDVYEIAKRYRQTILSEHDKTVYLNALDDTARYYGRDSYQYKEKVRTLNASFDLKTNIANKVPQMFDEYKVVYRRYFEKELVNLCETQGRLVYLQIGHQAQKDTEGEGPVINPPDDFIDEDEIISYA